MDNPSLDDIFQGSNLFEQTHKAALPDECEAEVDPILPNIELANNFSNGRIAEFETLAQKHREKFDNDNHPGPVKPTRTCLTLSPQDVAKITQLSSPKEAEMHVLQMIQEGGIFATFNQKNGIVSFVADPEEYETCLMILDFDSSIQREACSSAAFSMEQASVVVVPVARFINSCDMEQIRMAPEKFTSLCRRFVDCVVQLETPLRGTTPLRAAASMLTAIRNIQSSLKLLTSSHMEFLVLSLSYKAGLSILDEYIFKGDQQKDPFLYCSYRGMICIGQKRFGKALELLHNFFSSLPIYTSAVAQRNLKNFFQGNTLGLVKPASSKYGKGTTVIAVIGPSGIFVASDGRIIHDKGNIVDGSGQKIFLLGNNICFAFAGCVYLAHELLHRVKGVVEDCGAERKMFRAKAKCDRYIKAWMLKKENKNKVFPTLVLLCGYIRGKPYIFVVGGTADCSLGSNVGYIKGIGSGKGWAEDFAVKELSKGGNLGKDEYVQCVIRAVVVASLHSGGSGGRVRPAIVTPAAVEFPNPCHHILHHLFTDYSLLERYLENKLFLLSFKNAYTVFGEMAMRDFAVKNFVGVNSMHILGIDGDSILRIVGFGDKYLSKKCLGGHASVEYSSDLFLIKPSTEAVEHLSSTFSFDNHVSFD